GLGDAEGAEQRTRVTRVLGGNHVGAEQRLARPRAQVREVADRRGDDLQPPVAPAHYNPRLIPRAICGPSASCAPTTGPSTDAGTLDHPPPAPGSGRAGTERLYEFPRARRAAAVPRACRGARACR